MPNPIDDQQLKAIANAEIRSAMGEITGEISNDRAEAMDYYYGEPVGKLYQPNSDRSSVIITTLRDTVEWMMPQLMRMFAQPDKVAEFQAVGAEDEEAADQETQAINHIFWRQNEGFLVLYTWFKDALLQKNGTVKYWITETEERDREEYDGLTDMALAELEADDELEAIEHEPSEIQSVDGQRLHHVVFERKSLKKSICIENIPPEQFLISDDARSLDVQTKRPRMVGHHCDKTADELREMGFEDAAIEQMMKGDDEAERYDEEWTSRYNYADEQQILTGGTDYAHESQRRTTLYELYMDLDRDGDGFAELLKVYVAGDYIEAEEADHVPFACLTPYINPHKHHGLSQHDMVRDLQEISTQVFRNVLDNLVLTNNTRPVANERIDLDSLLATAPGAPIYVEDKMPVGEAITPFAPPPMWKDGLTLLEYVDQVRKDRTGIGDETMGLDPQTLANVNTGVMLEAIEAARGKIELVARIFAETGIKWLFRGVHELARKSYDQELRYELSGQYVAVSPQQWRKRTDITVSVGTATGSQQRELAALAQIGETQARMVEAGGLGVTVLPHHIYRTAKLQAENLGQKDGDQFFLNPLSRIDPQVQQLIAIQVPQPQKDPNTDLLAMTAQIEQGKVQVSAQKNQMDFAVKQAELALKREENALRTELEAVKAALKSMEADAKNQTAQDKIATDAAAKEAGILMQRLETEIQSRQKAQDQLLERYRAELQSFTTLAAKQMDVAGGGEDAVEDAAEVAEESRPEVVMHAMMADIAARLDRMSEEMTRPRPITRDAEGRPTAIGDRKITYNEDGTIAQIG